jgi:hypothetical protein
MGKSIVNIDRVKYVGTKGDTLEVILNDNKLVNIRVGDLVYYHDEMSFFDGTKFVPMMKEDEKLVDKNGEEIKEGNYISVRKKIGVELAHPFYGRLKTVESHVTPVMTVEKWLVIETVNCEEAIFNPRPTEIRLNDYEVEKVTFDDIKKLCIAEQQHFIDVTKDNIKAQRRQLKFYKQKMLNLKKMKIFQRKD